MSTVYTTTLPMVYGASVVSATTVNSGNAAIATTAGNLVGSGQMSGQSCYQGQSFVPANIAFQAGAAGSWASYHGQQPWYHKIAGSKAGTLNSSLKRLN